MKCSLWTSELLRCQLVTECHRCASATYLYILSLTPLTNKHFGTMFLKFLLFRLLLFYGVAVQFHRVVKWHFHGVLYGYVCERDKRQPNGISISNIFFRRIHSLRRKAVHNATDNTSKGTIWATFINQIRTPYNGFVESFSVTFLAF